MTVELAEIARYMRMGRALPEGPLAARVLELRAEGLAAVRPARVWRRFDTAGGTIGADDLQIKIQGKLARHLECCGAAYLVCGTIGPQFDALLRRVSVNSAADALIVQAIGAALIEKYMDSTEDEIRRELAPGESLVQRYSPGYGDFPLAAQRELLALLDAPRTAGVSLTDTLLMVPSKSVSAVIGVKKGEEPK